jgi:hypothetical protein
MNEMAQILLASAAALIVPGAWGWFIHWLYFRYRLTTPQTFAEPAREMRRASDANDWYYQI